MSSTRADRGKSGSLAGLRLCMVVHAVGNIGGSRPWQGLLGRRPDWGIGPPRSTSVRKGSLIGDIRGDQAIEDARYSAPVDGRSIVGRDGM
jgi:hypothetical protein